MKKKIFFGVGFVLILVIIIAFLLSISPLTEQEQLGSNGYCEDVFENEPICKTITTEEDCNNYGDCYWVPGEIVEEEEPPVEEIEDPIEEPEIIPPVEEGIMPMWQIIAFVLIIIILLIIIVLMIIKNF